MNKTRQRKLEARNRRIASKQSRYLGQGPVPKKKESKAIPVIKEESRKPANQSDLVPTGNISGRGKK